MLDKPNNSLNNEYRSTKLQSVQAIWIMQLQNIMLKQITVQLLSLKFCGIEKAMMSTREGDVLKKLAQREIFWICTLNTMPPNGLNDVFILKFFFRLRLFVIYKSLYCCLVYDLNRESMMVSNGVLWSFLLYTVGFKSDFIVYLWLVPVSRTIG